MLSLQDIAGDSGELDFKALKEEIVANGKVICPMQGCDEDFRSLWGLKRHLRQFHCDSEKREGSGKFNCNKCSRSFQTRVALRKHSVEVHSVGSETEGTSLSSPGFSSPSVGPAKAEKTPKQNQKKSAPRKTTPKNRQAAPSAAETQEGVSSQKKSRKKSKRDGEILGSIENDTATIAAAVKESSSVGQAQESPQQQNKRKRKTKQDREISGATGNTPPSVADTNVRKSSRQRKKKVIMDEEADEEEVTEIKEKRPRKRQGKPVNEDEDPPATAAKKSKKEPKGESEKPRKSGASKTADEKALDRTLRNKLRKYKKLDCPKKDCRAKFTSFLGYKSHVVTCGKSAEEREKFPCEFCGKVYFSLPGMKYHVKTVHTVQEVVEESEEERLDPENAETPAGGKGRRSAAVKAERRFQQLSEESGAMHQVIDVSKYMVNTREDLLSEDDRQQWLDKIHKDGQGTCRNEECGKVFKTPSSFLDHYYGCGQPEGPFKCLLCKKSYYSSDGLRGHIGNIHGKQLQQEQKASRRKERSKVDEDDSRNGDDEFRIDEEIESSDNDEFLEMEIEEEEEEEDLEDEDGDQEDLSDGEVVMWDSKRGKVQRYSKAPKRIIYNRFTSLQQLTGPKTPEFQFTDCWRRVNFSKEVLFPHLMPSKKYWSSVKESEVDEYLPRRRMSPHFRVERAKSRGQDKQLSLFESTPKENSGKYGDVTFFVGGPVWAMNWCPVPDNVKGRQILAISTHRTFEESHVVHEAYSKKGLLQLWDAGDLRVADATCGNTPYLALAIAHDFGALWEVSWCPSGTWQASEVPPQGAILARLGLLALACSDGIVRILSIPHPNQLGMPNTGKEQERSFRDVVFSCTPHVELVPCAAGVNYEMQSGQAFCVRWLPWSGHHRLAAGFSDGTVAVWDLLKESILCEHPDQNGGRTKRLAPFVHIRAHPSVVRSLAWSPGNPSFLITGSFERQYKVWDISQPASPVLVNKKLRTSCLAFEIEWPLYHMSILTAEDECLFVPPTGRGVRCLEIVECDAHYRPVLVNPHYGAAMSLSVSDYGNMLVSADATGEVVGFLLVHLMNENRTRNRARWSVYQASLQKIKQEGDKSEEREQQSVNDRQEAQQSETDRQESSLPEDNPDTGRSTEEKGNAGEVAPPSSRMEKMMEQYQVVYRESNSLQFKDFLPSKNEEMNRLSLFTRMQPPQYNRPYLEAIHKVRLNPNKSSFAWLATGGAAGLARLHLAKCY